MGDRYRYQRSGARSQLALFRPGYGHRPGAALAGGLPGAGAAASFPVADRGSPVKPHTRRFPVGAEITGAGAHFRVWAPVRRTVEVVFDAGDTVPLEVEGLGYFSGTAPHARGGSRYKYVLDGAETCPDPASRFQPEGPHGWSEVVDAATFQWTDRSWRGIALPQQVIYEMHIGTFTKEGSWRSAQQELPNLAETGITVL